METILNPVLVYSESYAYLCTPSLEFDESQKTTLLQSSGRLTEDCIFTQFEGPELQSNKIITMSPGNEAIFAKLPDYTYEISWELKGRKAKPWTIVDGAIAYQIFDIFGRIVEFSDERGSCVIYGFNFPFVVELPAEEKLHLNIRLGNHLRNKDPLFPGKHCLVIKSSHKCSPRLTRFSVYENIAQDKLTKRILSKNLREYSSKLREEYLKFFEGLAEVFKRIFFRLNKNL